MNKEKVIEALEEILDIRISIDCDQFGGTSYDTIANRYPKQVKLLRKAIYSMKDAE